MLTTAKVDINHRDCAHTVRQVADLLSFSERHIRRLIKSQELRAERLGAINQDF